MNAEIVFLAKHFSVSQKTIRKCLDQASKKLGLPKKKVLEVVSASLAPGLGLGDLPMEILFEISLKHLPVEDILRFCQTSRKYQALCEDRDVWKYLLRRDYGVTLKDGDPKEEYQFLRDREKPQKLAAGRGSVTMIDRQGRVFVWGALWRPYGRPKILQKLEQLKITGDQVSGSLFTTAVVSSGDLYVWGSTDTINYYDHAEKEVSDGIYQVNVGEKIRQVSVGHWMIGVITQKGNVYVLYGNLRPNQKNIQNVGQISCSYDGFHSGVIKEGDLYMWGSDYQALGLKVTRVVTEPTKVPFPSKVKIRSVSCGSDHTGAVTTTGDLYMWGSNKYGEIGNGTSIRVHKPKRILRGVQQVSCGENYTGAILKGGQLYMWGSNEMGQLGFYSQGDNQKTPFEIAMPEDIREVSCGSHITAVITQSFKVYAWGYARWKPHYQSAVAEHWPHHITDL